MVLSHLGCDKRNAHARTQGARLVLDLSEQTLGSLRHGHRYHESGNNAANAKTDSTDRCMFSFFPILSYPYRNHRRGCSFFVQTYLWRREESWKDRTDMRHVVDGPPRWHAGNHFHLVQYPHEHANGNILGCSIHLNIPS